MNIDHNVDPVRCALLAQCFAHLTELVYPLEVNALRQAAQWLTPSAAWMALATNQCKLAFSSNAFHILLHPSSCVHQPVCVDHHPKRVRRVQRATGVKSLVAMVNA